MFSFWDYGTQFYELYHLIITFCLLSDQVHQGAILRKPGGVCQAMAVKWQFANACKVSVTEGGGTRGQAGSGGSAMPPIPGAGGKTLSWAPGLLAVCGGWPGGVRHSVWIMAQPAPSQTSDQCQLPLAWERPEWASWPRVSVRGPGAHRGQVTITELPAHREPELGLVSGCLSWELRAGPRSSWKSVHLQPPAQLRVSSSSPPDSRLLLLGLLIEENQFSSSKLLLSGNLRRFRTFSTPFLRVASSREKGRHSGKRISGEADVRF